MPSTFREVNDPKMVPHSRHSKPTNVWDGPRTVSVTSVRPPPSLLPIAPSLLQESHGTFREQEAARQNDIHGV